MSRERRRPRRAFDEIFDLDILASVANLFDAAIVFAAALLVALLLKPKVREALMESDLEKTGRPVLEKFDERALAPLPRLRPSGKDGSGEGERLGIAYRLKSGEIVYIPE